MTQHNGQERGNFQWYYGNSLCCEERGSYVNTDGVCCCDYFTFNSAVQKRSCTKNVLFHPVSWAATALRELLKKQAPTGAAISCFYLSAPFMLCSVLFNDSGLIETLLLIQALSVNPRAVFGDSFPGNDSRCSQQRIQVKQLDSFRHILPQAFLLSQCSD